MANYGEFDIFIKLAKLTYLKNSYVFAYLDF